MANKTFIPAFKASVGDWTYYICIMKYAQVAREVQFAHELGGNRDLNTLIQRGIGARTQDIVKYLLRSDHRFLGSLIVATWGGDPEYQELRMDDPDELLKGMDSGFGVLTLDGSHQFFALDGQHRLKAIKDAIKQLPELGAEDICVLLVSHYDTDEGRQRTQRLFTNINRNARTTTLAENIALDVDDGFAITTRAILDKHPFFSQPGRIRVFTRPPTTEGQFTLAGSSVPKTDKGAFTTITVLYDLLRLLAHGLPPAFSDLENRPDEELLEQAYNVLVGQLEALLKACGDLVGQLTAVQDARAVRAPKDHEEQGHPLMRPVVQKAVARTLNLIMEQSLLTWEEALNRLGELEWRLGAAPWLAVFGPDSGRMLTGKDNTQLLEELLRVHLAPRSKAEITRARRTFKEIRGENYPVSVEELEAKLPASP